MRLLNTTTLAFEEFYDTQQVKYSILSHCWSQDRTDPEVTFQAYLSGTYNPEGQCWKKILRCCALSKERGYQWTWIDTCCIDKSSSAELSETINSMFKWYQDSSECYVFMEDCDVDTLPRVEEFDKDERWKQGMHVKDVANVETFSKSRWFKRGWTLQELLAPREVLFYGTNKLLMGTKADLASLLSYASGIAQKYILEPNAIPGASVAVRMSWASDRTTTRVEDVGYSLLGIFNINMPLLYGEGQKAFQRLQHEIVRTSTDYSIFTWGLDVTQLQPCSILAKSPGDFRNGADLRITFDEDADIKSYSITNAGLTISTNTLMRLYTTLLLDLGWNETHHRIVLHMREHRNGRWYRHALITQTWPSITRYQLLKAFTKFDLGSLRTIHAAIGSHEAPPTDPSISADLIVRDQRHRWRYLIMLGPIARAILTLPLVMMLVSQATVLLNLYYRNSIRMNSNGIVYVVMLCLAVTARVFALSYGRERDRLTFNGN
ncbi:hypothetical protein LTR95_000151 [Oleoguttula sp. CCFEE 5521]